MTTSAPVKLSPEQIQMLDSRIAENNEMNRRAVQKRQMEQIGSLSAMIKAQRLKIDLLIDAVLRIENTININFYPDKKGKAKT